MANPNKRNPPVEGDEKLIKRTLQKPFTTPPKPRPSEQQSTSKEDKKSAK